MNSKAKAEPNNMLRYKTISFCIDMCTLFAQQIQRSEENVTHKTIYLSISVEILRNGEWYTERFS